jgi:hypothetical protein
MVGFITQRKAGKGSGKTTVLRMKPTKQSPAEAMKKSLGSPLNPTVPGPRESAKTLTNEKAPDIMPKPRPTTEIKKSKSFFYLFRLGRGDGGLVIKPVDL